MAINKETVEKIQAAYLEFILLAGDRYKDTQENCDALKKQMLDAGISAETGWIFAGAWTEAWLRASKADLLNEPDAPVVLTKEELAQKEAERIYKLTQRDRYEGSIVGNKTDAPQGVAEEAQRRKDAEQIKAHKESLKQKAEVQMAREAAQAALVVPTVAQLVAGEFPMASSLSAKEADQYTREQLRAYFFNSRQAQTRIEFDRNAEREQRRRDFERANA